MSRLNREEWQQLDKLLGKHGFGGYYDLLECLKIVLSRIAKDRYAENKIKDLKTVVDLLLAFSSEKKREA